jgi:dolichol-phosphate mannosyltransferase
MADFIKKMLKKRYVRQFIKFAIVGAVGILVNLGTLYITREYFGFPAIRGLIIGIVLATTTNFIGNKLWTFRNREKKPGTILIQYGNYWLCSAPGIALQIFSFYGLVTFMPWIWYINSGLIAIALASLLNFVLSKFWVFRILKDEPIDKKSEPDKKRV